MTILQAYVRNFGSYKELDFIFENQDLTLISGPTGSGKSTLCDIIPWVLFGRTAKGGAVDEVISWNATESTYGHAILNLGDKCVWVVRTRKPNDLYYVVDGVWEHPFRGKDLNDTQKRINEMLGMTADTYLAGAYFHEFSQTAQFFTSNAKNRRIITEQLADLSLAKKLHENNSIYLKSLKEEIQEVTQNIMLENNTNKSLLKALAEAEKNNYDWIQRQYKRIKETQERLDNFEADKAKEIEELKESSEDFISKRIADITDLEDRIELTERELLSYSHVEKETLWWTNKQAELGAEVYCKECGAPKDHSERLVITRELHNLDKAFQTKVKLENKIRDYRDSIKKLQVIANPFTVPFLAAVKKENTYAEELRKIKSEPILFVDTLKSAKQDLKASKETISELTALLSDLNVDKSDMELLGNVIDSLRSTVIGNTVNFLQTSTNDLLERHFDAEIRVTLDVSAADKLEVTIQKDGNIASFSQLSKGQRQMLKLCFGVSVMRAVSNYNGTNFNCLFFDEALDGMDDNIKVKAFGLLEQLSTNIGSVFCVEHSEAIKPLFTNRINVMLEDGVSIINEEA